MTRRAIHGIAYCQDCDWSTEDPVNVRALSMKHAKKHGHAVEGEIAIAFTYDYREKQTKRT